MRHRILLALVASVSLFACKGKSGGTALAFDDEPAEACPFAQFSSGTESRCSADVTYRIFCTNGKFDYNAACASGTRCYPPTLGEVLATCE